MATGNINYPFLLEQLQAGSAVAFDELYQSFSKELLRNILYQVKDMEVAKDLTQEVFLILWKQREKVDTERPLKHYLFSNCYPALAEQTILFSMLKQQKECMAEAVKGECRLNLLLLNFIDSPIDSKSKKPL